MTQTQTRLQNFVGGHWEPSRAAEVQPVINPATAQTLADVPLTTAQEVDRAVQAAEAAFHEWREVAVGDRIQPLFKLKALIEEHIEDLARTITDECGKTRAESIGEIRRGIENIEVATGIPMLMQGYNNENIASGIDEHMFRQPLGVVAAITPFNFPAMIPLWFLPYAVATGNAFLLKPSERVPLTTEKLFRLIEQAGFPAGVLSLVNGGKDVVNALLDHPQVRAISFVGSTPVARSIYERGAKNGKRVQAQGGAKNPAVILPDADMEMAATILADSAFGCAGQRCLATSVAITVGGGRKAFTDLMVDLAQSRRVGYGFDEGVQMGPVINEQSKERVEGLIEKGVQEGARAIVDGRQAKVPGYEQGYFVGPTLLENVPPQGEIARTEIFGPVLSLMHAANVDEAIRLVNERAFGNQASLFTSSGAAARKFRHEVRAGNIGINIGVAAPIAYFPFSGWGDSFFGDLHAQGRHGVEFYTETKVVVERWPREWSRTF
ncbi:CoA-acylating methylmalonate-semialdehyde dehydrogenase [Deinococcus metallilatus]|uniref:methylmalonate-semialdehyde dehydrogenase (CoA acylating) n=1 Tax=Deinococcus metallilatus TaxID=1211322 RepID=A0ABR6MUK1_9DEIO|nr:CoA-acylating methylmalonate-semialdehyde dehydrogenase [Deinococcus metallilatus]MBB5295628.1 malonate-semialdehyde dehydrogenase (acetylating)/methylmalonate-semialdehyde dehydrogenase [Deinococcus metallilatus]GMA14157.1 methylmalonate-semialdehyde dehydrogenase (acylating) [Deinococcus metallilatus]